MKTLLLASVLALVAGCGGCASVPEVFYPKPATLSLGEEGRVYCSGTAVGPQTLLTASHCIDEGQAALEINGAPVAILDVQRDLTDHALLHVTHTFDTYAEIVLFPPAQGERIRVWGNPGGMKDQYREGYIAGLCPLEDCYPLDAPADNVITIEIAGWKGDSGAALFNEAGQVVGVISTVTLVGPGYIPMGAVPFTFTPEQLEGIR